MRDVLFSFIALALAACSPAEKTAAEEPPKEPVETAQEVPTQSESQSRGRIYGYRIVAEYPHDTDLFTQGLFVADGELYETTGKKGASRLIRHSILGSEPEKRKSLPDTVFGEGSVAVGNKIITLTWRAGLGFVHDLNTLEQLATFEITGEGWGLTHDGSQLILSDGTSDLRFLDPGTFQETGRLAVTVNGQPLHYINELEWIKGEVWANVWGQDVIVRIDPKTGEVISMIDMRGLYEQRPHHDAVLNGIAYDAGNDRLFVTGKWWPKIYEIELVARD